MDKKIVLTSRDNEKLRALIQNSISLLNPNRAELVSLLAELDKAEVVEPEKIPAGVVTMDSVILIKDLDTSKEEEYRLVFPPKADIRKGNISILAPVGIAILGYKEGDSIEWKVPGGLRRLKILKVTYQPEAAGDFDQ
ncbi:MAG: nucleoside diphosphate kinase regulator [Candidatus Aminicenantales bacterium]